MPQLAIQHDVPFLRNRSDIVEKGMRKIESGKHGKLVGTCGAQQAKMKRVGLWEDDG